ncbi:hypothetical protein QJS04_geneDACA013174 [Acorus gramineus]|uniref:Reverse transcriptase zinc-binding domain-containing protein n=1 Tax=Acorus gramineus TaxID=55184 RepID=A0AAV9BAS3_ACOGR|nr:hypothetical protein QJS04_geneDACA013174 [Acorus gramineus]
MFQIFKKIKDMHVLMKLTYIDIELLCITFPERFEPTDCALCNADPETVEHLLLRCPLGSRLWCELSRATGMRLQFQKLSKLRDALQTPATLSHHLPAQFTRLLLPTGLWALWRTRNGVLFGGQRLYFKNLWDTALQLLKDRGKHLVGLSGVYHLGGVIGCEV